MMNHSSSLIEPPETEQRDLEGLNQTKQSANNMNQMPQICDSIRDNFHFPSPIKNVATENVSTEDDTKENVSTEDDTEENNTTEKDTKEYDTTENDTENVTTENVTSENVTAENDTSKKVSEEEAPFTKKYSTIKIKDEYIETYDQCLDDHYLEGIATPAGTM